MVCCLELQINYPEGMFFMSEPLWIFIKNTFSGRISSIRSCAHSERKSPFMAKAWFIGPLPLPRSSIAARAQEI